MKYFLCIVGIISSFFMLKYREQIGDTLGEADWMRKVGGVYVFVTILAAFIFLWSLAELTNTSSFFFGPILWLLPGTHRGGMTDL